MFAEPGPSAGDDAVILNEKSPVIMSRAPDDINIDTHQTTNNPADSAASVKHKGSKKPSSVPIKPIQKSSSGGVSGEIADSQTHIHNPVAEKLINTNDAAIEQLTKMQSVDPVGDSSVDENTGITGDETQDDLDQSQMEMDLNVNHPGGDLDEDEDDNTYYNTIGKRVPVSQLTDYVNAKSFEDTENEFEVSLYFPEN